MNELLSKKVESIANEYLKLLNLPDIEVKRKSQCTSIEIFYTMLIRAFMSCKKMKLAVGIFILSFFILKEKGTLDNNGTVSMNFSVGA